MRKVGFAPLSSVQGFITTDNLSVAGWVVIVNIQSIYLEGATEYGNSCTHGVRRAYSHYGMQAYWQAIGPQLKLFTAAEVEAFRKRYYLDEKINSDVLKLLEMLYEKYQLAVVSNHPPGLQLWLKEWQIHGLFEQIVCSGDEGVIKPNPAIFYMTLERLQVEPGETVFIDDTKQHVIAAQALGMRALLFTTAEKLLRELGELGMLGCR